MLSRSGACCEGQVHVAKDRCMLSRSGACCQGQVTIYRTGVLPVIALGRKEPTYSSARTIDHCRVVVHPGDGLDHFISDTLSNI